MKFSKSIVTLLFVISLDLCINVQVVEKLSGSDVVFYCNSQRLPDQSSVNHVWRFNEKLVLGSELLQKDTGLNNINVTINNHTFSYLHIADIVMSNNGRYTCSVDDNFVSTFVLKVIRKVSSSIVKSASLGASITFTCSFQGIHVWRFNGEVIYVDKFKPSDIGYDNVHGEIVNRTVSYLHVDKVSMRNVGNYSCNIGQNAELTYHLRVLELYVTIDGRDIIEVQYLLSDVKYNVTCVMLDAERQPRQIVSLSSYHLTADDLQQRLHKSIIGFNTVTITEEFKSNTLWSSFTCAKLDGTGKECSPSTSRIDVFVLPELEIQSESRNLSGIYQAFLGETLVLKCVAFSSRPPVDVYWEKEKGNKIKHLESITKASHSKESTQTTESQLKVVVTDNMLLTCGCSGVSSNHRLETSLFVAVDGGIYSRTVIVGGAVLASFIVVACSFSLGIYFQRKRGSQFSPSLTNQQHTRDVCDSADHDEASATAQKTSGQIKSLTEIDFDTGFNDNDCEMFGTSVTLLSRIHCGDIIDYWKGTFSSSGGRHNCICESLSENLVPRNDRHNFLSLTKSLRGLPKHQNVVSLLGSVTDKVPYCIYREFVENGSLLDYLQQKYRSYKVFEESSEPEALYANEYEQHLIMLAKHVADAMDFLDFYQFNHPALRASKVLLSTTMVCKLYDFWPRDLSSYRIVNLMKSPNPPTAWLPPETIFLRKYDSFSDVWTFGVLLWEIFSLGGVPFQYKQSKEIEDDIRKMKLLPQPPTCPNPVFEIMSSAWEKASENRPTFAELKDRIHSLGEFHYEELGSTYSTMVTTTRETIDTQL